MEIESRESNRRSWISAAVVCAVVAVLFVYGRPVGFLLYTRWNARKTPELWHVPAPLPAVSAEISTGKTYTYFGYQFESPWMELIEEKKFSSQVILYFSSGPFILIFDPAQITNELAAIKEPYLNRGVSTTSVFGPGTLQSRYALLSKILNVTPGDLRLSWSRQEMAENSILLLMKDISAPRLNGHLYSFQTETVRGFQEGDPGPTAPAVIEAFDAQDRKIELWIGAKRGATSVPSQADVSRIVHSLRRVAISQSK